MLSGTAVVTQCSAALWVDGRYHLQADAQTDENWLVMKQGKLKNRILDCNLFKQTYQSYILIHTYVSHIHPTQMMLGVFSRLDFSFQGLKDTPTIADWLHKTITEEGGQIGVDSSVMSSGLIIYVITFYNLISPYFISFIK